MSVVAWVKGFSKEATPADENPSTAPMCTCLVLQHGITHDLKALHLDNSTQHSDITRELKKKQIKH